MNKNITTPDNWIVSTLGKYVSEKTKGVIPNKTPDKIFELFSVPSFESRKPEILKGLDIGSNKQLVEEGTVLLCKINPRINRSWVVSSHSSHEKIASTEWITFPRNDAFEPKYLEFYLKLDPFRDYLAANASGVGGSLMRVKPATLKNYRFPIAPLKQQKRIVAEIEKQFSRLDEAVENLKRVKANLKRYKASVLKAAVEGKLTEQWRDEHPDVEPASKLLERILTERRKKWEEAELAKLKAKGKMPKDDRWKAKYKGSEYLDARGLYKLPGAWCWSNVGQIASQKNNSLSSGPFGSNLGTKDYVKSGIPVIRGKNIQDGRILLKQFVYVTAEKAEEINRSIAHPGDVVIIAVGSSGRPGIIPIELEHVILSQNCNKITCDTKFMLPEFLTLFFQTPFAQNQISGKTTDTVRKFFSLTNFKQIIVPVPPISEQVLILEIVNEQLANIERLQGQVDANFKRADRLRQSILKKAFSGQLIASANKYEAEPSHELPMAAEATPAYGVKE